MVEPLLIIVQDILSAELASFPVISLPRFASSSVVLIDLVKWKCQSTLFASLEERFELTFLQQMPCEVSDVKVCIVELAVRDHRAFELQMLFRVHCELAIAVIAKAISS